MNKAAYREKTGKETNMDQPIITKQHFKDILNECVEKCKASGMDYEETYADIEPIQSLNFEYQQKKGFHEWLSAKYPDIYDKTVKICNQKESWRHKNIWCMMGAAGTIMTETKTIDLFTDYCFDNAKFMDAVYENLKDYLDEDDD